MATITKRKIKNGPDRWGVQIRTSKTRKCATFATEEQAIIWALKFDKGDEYQDENSHLIERKHPMPPPAMLSYPLPKAYVPSIRGIYFFWDKGKVVYVGKSINLQDRLSYKSHHHLKKHYHISFIAFQEVDDQMLSFIECWYIGSLEPVINFTKPRN